MKQDVQPRLFTYEEAGKYLGVSAATVKKLASRGRLTVVKLGKAARIDRRQLDQMIEATVPTFVPTLTVADRLGPDNEYSEVIDGKR